MRSRLALLGLLLTLATAACQPRPGTPAASIGAAPAVRAITFPVQGPVRYGDDYGDCRGSGCSRPHEGIDVFGTKMQPLVAAASGTVTYLRLDGGRSAGNSLAITDGEGWAYWYLHINNDTPGTDDGAAPLNAVLAPGVWIGKPVAAGQVIAYMGDSGNAEGTSAHLHFEIDRPGGVNINPYASLRGAAAPAASSPAPSATPVLRRGMTGPAVLAWQRDLVAVYGPVFVPNGVFGPATESYTRWFQGESRLTPDAIVGPATRAAMNARLGR